MLEKALRKVVRTLDRLAVPYALIGGLAVAARGAVRATKDVDLMVDWPLTRAAEVVRALQADGHSASFTKGAFDDPVAGVVRVAIPDPEGLINVDILFPSKRWQAEAVARASVVVLGNAPIRVVQAADLFLLKLHAGGPLDLYDAACLYDVQSNIERVRWKERAAAIRRSKAFERCLQFLPRRD